MGFKKWIAKGMLAISLMGAGKAEAREHLAELQAATQQAGPNQKTEAGRYLEIISKYFGMSAKSLQVTLAKLAHESILNPKFKRYCKSRFKCKRVLIHLMRDDKIITEQPEILDAINKAEGKLSQKYLHHWVSSYSNSYLKVTNNYTIDQFASYGLVSSTTPVYLNRANAKRLGVTEGWVLVVERVVHAFKTKNDAFSDLFAVEALLIHI